MRSARWLALVAVACVRMAAHAAENPYGLPDGLYSEITTPRGVVVSELFYKKVPMTVMNHVGLAEGTLGAAKEKPYYDGLTWHRVVPNFVIQGGEGKEIGYEFPDEIVPGLRHDSVGVMQMANDGPDTNGSQFCLMTSEVNRLNYNHTVFGHVVRGLEVLPKIQQGDTMQVKILRLGDEARAFKADETSFKALVAKAKRYGDLPQKPGPEAFFDDADGILPTTPARASDFNHKLANFERFTGVRVIGRMLAKTPTEATGDKRDIFLLALAIKMKVEKEGAVVVYFEDTDSWHVWIAPASQASFIAGPRKPDGTKNAVAAGKTLAQATAAFLDEAKADVPRLTEIAIKATPPGPDGNVPEFTQGQKIKYQVDSILDKLIFRLEPAASSLTPKP